jgi:hypothetical protein
MRRAAGALALLALVAPFARAQQTPARLFGSPASSSLAGIPDRGFDGLFPGRDSVGRSTPWSVLASSVIPGSGQAVLKQDRFIAYLAIEAYAWARYAADVREGRRARASYRNLASEVARRPFSISRPLGDFDYYERMEKFAESGAFDAVPGGDLDPEPDETTANGAIWLLARETYWSDPNKPPARDEAAWRNAEGFYRDRAVQDNYRWSWTNARLEYAEFRRTIRRSNNAYRTSLQDLGLVIANHALSTVDAFITVRLRRHAEAGGQRFDLYGSVPFGH